MLAQRGGDAGVTVIPGSKFFARTDVAHPKQPPSHRVQPRHARRDRRRGPAPGDGVSGSPRRAPAAPVAADERGRYDEGTRRRFATSPPTCGERAQGFLTIGETASGPHSAPVVIINGAEDGPILCLTAGVHATEYAPIDAVMRVVQSLEPSGLRGAVIAVPVANMRMFEPQRASSHRSTGSTSTRWRGARRRLDLRKARAGRSSTK